MGGQVRPTFLIQMVRTGLYLYLRVCKQYLLWFECLHWCKWRPKVQDNGESGPRTSYISIHLLLTLLEGLLISIIWQEKKLDLNLQASDFTWTGEKEPTVFLMAQQERQSLRVSCSCWHNSGEYYGVQEQQHRLALRRGQRNKERKEKGRKQSHKTRRGRSRDTQNKGRQNGSLGLGWRPSDNISVFRAKLGPVCPVPAGAGHAAEVVSWYSKHTIIKHTIKRSGPSSWKCVWGGGGVKGTLQHAQIKCSCWLVALFAVLFPKAGNGMPSNCWH